MNEKRPLIRIDFGCITKSIYMIIRYGEEFELSIRTKNILISLTSHKKIRILKIREVE